MKYFIHFLFLLAFTQSGKAQLPSYLSTNGLVAWYPFTGNANDQSGNANNPTYNNATPAADRFGSPNSAFSFNGSQYIKGSCASFPTTNRTISFWYRANNLGNNSTSKLLMGYGGSSAATCGNSWIIILENIDFASSGKIEVQGHCQNFRTYTGYPQPANNTWHHVTITYDGNNTRYYFNGILSQSFPQSITSTNVAGKSYCIGTEISSDGINHYFDSLNLGFDGLIDDVGIWNRALSAQEVSALFQTIPAHIPQNGLVAWYPFTGNANDASGNGNHPTTNNATLSSDRCGRPNSAYAFNGSQYIGGSCSSFPATTRTVSFWYKANNLGSNTTCKLVLGYGGGSCGSSWMVDFENVDFQSAGKIEVQGHCINFRTYTNYPLPANHTWHHITITYDGTSTKYYGDGTLIQSFNQAITTTNILNKSFYIGTSVLPNGVDPYLASNYWGFNGSLDDIGIWNRALTAQEVFALYKGETTIKAILTANGPTTFCQGDSVGLQANSSNTYTYAWKQNGNLISGSNFSYHVAKTTGLYQVLVTDTTNCRDSTSVNILVKNRPLISLITNGTDCFGETTLQLNSTCALEKVSWFKNETLAKTDSVLPSTIGNTVAGGNGVGGGANQLYYIHGFYVDKNNTVFTADFSNNRIQKQATYASIGTTIAGNGIAGVYLNTPTATFVNAAGDLYIADYGNGRILKIPSGSSSAIVVAGGNGIGAAANQFNGPRDIYVDAYGNMYIPDAYNHRIQKWSPGATTGVTVAGGNGAGNGANQFNTPTSVHVDNAGNVYVADFYNHRVQKWLPGSNTGITVAGGNGAGSASDQINAAAAVFVDINGNIFIADHYNHRIQKWEPGSIYGITVAGGNGVGSGQNQLNYPCDVFVSDCGAIYIADRNNNRIQKWENILYALPPNLTTGTYQVKAKAINQCNLVTNTVTIHPKPLAQFLINDTDQCQKNNHFQFTNTSGIASGNLSATWNLGNGDSSTNITPTKSFNQAGTYNIQLKVQSDKGCRDSISKTVNVFPQPHASFLLNNKAQCLKGNNFSGTNTSLISTGELNYTWDTGNDTTLSTFHFLYTYPIPGNYQVKLFATSDKGCTDLASQTIEVFPHPKTQPIIGNLNSLCWQQQNYFISGGANSTWNWWVNNGSLQKGQGTDSTTVLWDKLTNGGTGTLYTYETNRYSCAGDTSQTVVRIFALLVNEVCSKNDIRVYPNPVRDVCTIDLINNNLNIKTMKIRNSLGQLVFEKDIAALTEQFNVSGWRNGIYFIQLDGNSGSFHKTLLIQ